MRTPATQGSENPLSPYRLDWEPGPQTSPIANRDPRRIPDKSVRSPGQESVNKEVPRVRTLRDIVRKVPGDCVHDSHPFYHLPKKREGTECRETKRNRMQILCTVAASSGARSRRNRVQQAGFRDPILNRRRLKNRILGPSVRQEEACGVRRSPKIVQVGSGGPAMQTTRE